MLLLSGDIGGTKTRLRLSDYSKKHYHAHQTETFFNKDFPCLEDIIEHFLAQYQIAKKDIQSACFAIAGPIVNDQVQLTNLTWHIDLPSLKRLMGIENIFLINDFEAIGHAIDSLEPDQLSCLQKGQAQKDALIAVTGPGTGLGVCLVDGKSDHSRVFATEGGHVDFSPANQEQFELLRFLNRIYGRVSIERMLCGKGIVNIYHFLSERYHHAFDPEITAAEISALAQKEGDSLAKQTLTWFMRIYGAFAGNLALTTLPFGGL